MDGWIDRWMDGWMGRWMTDIRLWNPVAWEHDIGLDSATLLPGNMKSV